MIRLIATSACAVLLAACGREIELRMFDDATAAASPILDRYVGMTHGAAWGDFDSDGRPDLYLTNHLNDATLLHNLGGGRFAEVTGQVFAEADLKGDKHGAAWADFDNDGHQDLVQLTGAVRGAGSEPKRLLHNEGGRLIDVAETMGVQNLEGRTRMPLWVDLDRDGRLDLVQGAEARFDGQTPPFVFMQGKSGFVAADEDLPQHGRSMPFCVLAQLKPRPQADMLCRLIGPGGALQAYDLAKLPAQALSSLPQTGFEDVAIADFDNDGLLDVLLARKNAPGPVAVGRPSERGLIASFAIDKAHVGEDMGVVFSAPGPMSVKVAGSGEGSELIAPTVVHIGETGTSPKDLSFEVNSQSGKAKHGAPGASIGVWIGSAGSDRWELHVTAPREVLAAGHPKTLEIQIAVEAGGPISKVEPVGPTQAEESPLRLFMQRDGKFVEESKQRGLGDLQVAGMNVVAADFDNDGHIDLFIVASGDVGRGRNLLLMNDGKGSFRAVKDAGGGLAGTAGVGDAVAAADYDGDGNVDLLLALGGSMGRSLGLPSDKGGYRLLHNNGSAGRGRHWLEIDLSGTRSNRDGIGAFVRVAAGGITQTRLQDAGIHDRAQNHMRLHFGLGSAAQAESIVVQWPSGTVQELRNVAGDRVLRIEEPRNGQARSEDAR
ncbi:MAG TPA: CRTAC1 family protein [Burkholderiaceae bacterium]|nr:CRTAC1 family protein [Burkholderiaceae bacterium]